MNFKTPLFTAMVLATTCSTVAMAQNKFLATVDEETPPVASCSAPAGMIAIVSNILPKDAYLARTGPSVDSDYRYSYYGLESRAFLTQDFMTTTDPATAEVCNQLEQGNITPEILQQFDDAIDSDLLWWSVEADKDLNYDPDYPDPSFAGSVGYLSAKHISFVTPEDWTDMTAPNALGYMELGGKAFAVPVPITSITGINTHEATLVAEATNAYASRAMTYCISGYEKSPLYDAFHPPGNENTYEPSTLPANQTQILIEDGVWSGCRIHDENVLEDFLGLDMGTIVEESANCTDRLILNSYGDTEISAVYLPYSYGAAGGIGTNFSTLCPEMTRTILQEDCDAGNDNSCSRLAEFVGR